MYSKSFEERLQEIIFTGPLKMKVLAVKIDKKYPTLMRELSPWDPDAKLGIVTVVKIVKVTKDRRIIDLILEECGMKED